MGVSISVALLNQIDKYLVVGFYGDVLYAYYSTNNSIASGLFTMISVGIMRGVYPAVLRAWRDGGKAAAKPARSGRSPVPAHRRPGGRRSDRSLAPDVAFPVREGL